MSLYKRGCPDSFLGKADAAEEETGKSTLWNRRGIGDFFSRMRAEEVDLKSLGLRTGTRDGILAEIAKVYRLAAP